MKPEDYQELKALFLALRDVGFDERTRLVDQHCGDDVEKRRELVRLLEAHDQDSPSLRLHSPEEETVDAARMGTGNSPEATSAMPDIPGYQMLREISRGGQGVVYQAIQKSTKRKVAVKVLLEGPFGSASAKKRFEREVDLVAQLKHPSIITIFDSGKTTDGRLFFAMDYVRGVPLRDYVRDHKLTLEQTLELFGQVCAAVQYAHQKGVIHRDLKPTNILVEEGTGIREQGAGARRAGVSPATLGTPKILDFGLAKQMAAPVETVMSMTGHVVGTLPYMSPEQARGNPDHIDTRTDVYALGVILYELLTGHYPYPVVGMLDEVLRHIKDTQPTPPSRAWRADSGVSVRSARELRPGECPIDDEVQTIVLKALSKERDRRYQGAGELARDVAHYLAGEAIEARRDSAGYMLRKLLHRNRARAVAALAFAVMVFLAAVVSTVLWRRAVAAEAHARSEAEIAAEINRFLNEDFLAAADRGERQGRGDVTVREVLDAAARQLDNGWLQAQPMVEAAVRTSIGKTYGALGLYEAAYRHLDRGLRLRQEHRPADDLAVGRSYTELALAAARRGDQHDAEALVRRALVVFRNSDYREIELARCLDLMSTFAADEGNHAVAEQLAREALAVCQSSSPSTARDGAEISILDSLAWSLCDSPWSQPRPRMPERLDQAEALARQALARAQGVFGQDHPRVATYMHNLAWVLQSNGRFDEAERLHHNGLAMRERLLGPEHPRIGASLWHLAQCYLARGRLDRAEAQLRDLLAFNLRTGSQHWYSAINRAELGAVVRDQHRFSEGRDLLEEGCRGLINNAGAPPARKRWAFAQLRSLYEAWHAAEPGKGYDAKAAEWRKALASLERRIPSASDLEGSPRPFLTLESPVTGPSTQTTSRPSTTDYRDSPP